MMSIQVAATCESEALRDTSGGGVGILYDLSRQPLAERNDGNSPKASISLAGSRAGDRTIVRAAY